MDWTLLVTTAVLMALGTALVGVIFGRRVAQLIGWIGTLFLVVPLGLIILFGVLAVVRGDSPTASSDTVRSVRDYVGANLPGLIVSAVVGAVVGFMLRVVKKATPRAVRTKVKQHVRLDR
jgi:predicted MFS family arabinose efflux permease